MTRIRTLAGFTGSLLGSVLLLPVLVLGIPFVAVRGLFRLAARILGTRGDARPWSELIEFDPEVGWRAASGCDHHSASVEPFHVVTDTDGNRGTADLSESELVVIGDSFAFGYGVNEADCYWHHLASTPTTVVAAPGYDLAQEYLRLTQLRGQLRGKVVLWFIYHGNDLFDTLQPAYRHYRKPFFQRRGEHWEIRTDHVSETPWRITGEPDHYRRLAEICTPSALADRAFDAADALVGAAAELCESSDARLVIVSIPDVVQISTSRRPQLHTLVPKGTQVDPKAPDRAIREICQRRRVELLDLRAHLTVDDYLRQDVHWTAKGHQRVAKAIKLVIDDTPVMPRHVPAEPATMEES